MKQDLQSITEVTTMSSLEIAELCGKEHKHVLRDIRVLQDSLGPDLGSGIKSDTYINTNNQSQICYQLDKDSTICLVSGYDANIRMKIIKRWQELESQQPKVPTNFIEAMELATETLKLNEKLAIERDTAIKTKAHISDKKTATAMATASKAVKRVNKLEVQLDQSLQYATIKKMHIKTGKTFRWQLLKKAGTELGIKPKKIDDVNFDKVNAYHKDVWLKAYNLKID